MRPRTEVTGIYPFAESYKYGFKIECNTFNTYPNSGTKYPNCEPHATESNVLKTVLPHGHVIMRLIRGMGQFPSDKSLL